MEVKLLAITENPEELIEFAARVCYQSFNKITEGSAANFIKKLLAMGHETPFEHAYATFYIKGCSRAMTHQLVRHRLMSVSQQSQRYVSESNFEYVIPPSVPEEKIEEYKNDMKLIRTMYARWKKAGLKNEDARFVLPNACQTELVISANFREYRHIFKLRCTPHAQWEIRQACSEMLKILYNKAPNVFEDLISLTGLMP